MKIQLVYKFKNGVQAAMKPMDVYNIHGDGDWLRLMIKGKLDNQKMHINEHVFEYNDLQSIEVVFID